MKIPDRIVDLIVRAEDALDRLKLAYKDRFSRFDPARVVPYRGHGRPDRLCLSGRVMEAREVGFEPEPGIWTSVRNTIRRLETDEIRGARVRCRFRDQEVEVTADGEAFLELRLEPDPPVDPGWHEVTLEIVDSMAERDAGPVTGEILVPPPDADFIVVSDLDDTVVRTGATDRFSMFRTVLLNDARTRLPFPGVRSLYHAFGAGPSGGGSNPIFYVSRSAWNLYEMITGFLEHHGLPKGPVLLKDYGLGSALGGGEHDFKRRVLRDLLDFYSDAPFLLIGDSGQRDPEMYAEVARERPDRVRAVIIRDVTPRDRDREVRRIADGLEGMGVPMVVAGDSAEAAREAAGLGLVSGERVAEVEAERSEEERRRPPARWQRWLDRGATGETRD